MNWQLGKQGHSVTCSKDITYYLIKLHRFQLKKFVSNGQFDEIVEKIKVVTRSQDKTARSRQYFRTSFKSKNSYFECYKHQD